MRLKSKIREATRASKIAVLPGHTNRPQYPAVTQGMLESVRLADERAAHLNNTLREILNHGADVEPGRYLFHGEVFRCERCGCHYAEDGRFFHVIDSEVAKAEGWPLSEKEKPLPERGCPRCYVRDHCPCADCRKNRQSTPGLITARLVTGVEVE